MNSGGVKYITANPYILNPHEYNYERFRNA